MIAKYFLIGVLLFAQDSSVEESKREVAESLRRVKGGYPTNLAITVIAQYGDGTPARGYISCSGLWCKYGGGEPAPGDKEPDYCAPYLPFKTDSRGACIFNPPTYWGYNEHDDEQGYLTCYATAGLRSGKSTFPVYDGGIHVITIPGSSVK